MIEEFKPYTYLIGWSHLNKWYYGVRFKKNANPSDLWKTYFTSSKKVKEFRELYGEPDIIQIRKVFDNREKALMHEYKVINRLNCVRSNDWLNLGNFGFNTFDGNGRIIADETKEKIRQSLLGKKHEIPRHTEESKKKLSDALKGKKKPEGFGEHISKMLTR